MSSAALGGTGTALCWAAAVLSATQASRLIGAAATLGWVMTIGLLLAVPVVVVSLRGPAPGGTALVWLAVAGLSNVAGLRLEYAAIAIGKVGVVSQISSTEGMIAALLAVGTGEHLGFSSTACCLVIVGGVVLTARRDSSDDAGSGSRWIGMAVIGAILFGVDLFALGQAGARTSIVLVLIPARVVGTITVAAPLAVRRSLTLTKQAAPFLLITAVCELFGVLSYTAGARSSIAVAAVFTSQFSALAAIGAFVVYRERLAARQIGGLILAAIGVAALALLHG